MQEFETTANSGGGKSKLDACYHYSVREGAAAVGVAPITVWRAIYSGHLSPYRAGRRVILSGAQLIAWLDAGGKTGRQKGGGDEGR